MSVQKSAEIRREIRATRNPGHGNPVSVQKPVPRKSGECPETRPAETRPANPAGKSVVTVRQH